MQPIESRGYKGALKSGKRVGIRSNAGIFFNEQFRWTMEKKFSMSAKL